jgi:predicted aldo/keto reductase-like oxidoreductase
MDKFISRRKFIQTSSIAAVAASSAGLLSHCAPSTSLTGKSGMPMRVLGKTGEKISILGYGCGSQFMKMPDGEWEPHFDYAFKAGINYFDTASAYGANEPVSSEERLGRVIPPIRKEIFLLTKVDERDPQKARAEFERGLSRMKTDHVDALLIHAILPTDTVSDIESGIYRLITDLKKEKMVRYIGFSCMDSAERARDLLEKLDFDVVLLAMNATGYGNFVTTALPVARNKNLGVISMKIMRDIVNKGVASPEELLQYNWELPGVSVNLVSQTGMEPLKQNIDIALKYSQGKLTSFQPQELELRLAHMNNSDNFIWAQKHYYDGLMC